MVGTGAYGQLPVMKEVKHEAQRRNVELVILPTIQAIGPSQWEAPVSFPVDIGPDAVWFVRHFRQQFGREPEYTAAGSFAVGLEILVLAGSFEQEIQIMRARQRWPASIQAVAGVAAGVLLWQVPRGFGQRSTGWSPYLAHSVGPKPQDPATDRKHRRITLCISAHQHGDVRVATPWSYAGTGSRILRDKWRILRGLVWRRRAGASFCSFG